MKNGVTEPEILSNSIGRILKEKLVKTSNNLPMSVIVVYVFSVTSKYPIFIVHIDRFYSNKSILRERDKPYH